MDLPVKILQASSLFRGMGEEEIRQIVTCFGANVRRYGKGAFLWHEGEQVRHAGIVLQGVVDSEDADEATKTGALMEISELARAMEAEANIETLVTGKGFAQCVAVINGEACSVVVSNEGELAPAQISQINEIVYEQAGIQPVNVKIITK